MQRLLHFVWTWQLLDRIVFGVRTGRNPPGMQQVVLIQLVKDCVEQHQPIKDYVDYIGIRCSKDLYTLELKLHRRLLF